MLKSAAHAYGDAPSCGFTGMPSAAANVGSAQCRLTPEQIAAALQELVQGHTPSDPAPAPLGSAEPAKTARVLVADGHQVLLDGLRILINNEQDMQVVGRADDGETAVRRAAELQPDVVVMDICMPGVDGFEATRRIVSQLPNTKVVSLSSSSDALSVNRILRAGATGYLTKQRAFGELVQAIRPATHRHWRIPEAGQQLPFGRYARQGCG